MIQSVQRALDILSFFSLARPSLGIGELSELMGLPRTTVHGLVRTLLEKGFLQQDPGTKKYGLGFKIYELGMILGNTLEVNRKASAHLFSLSQRTGLEARLAIWEGGSVLVTIGASVRSLAFFAQVGPRMPAYCSASGKVFLAHLSPRELEEYLHGTEFVRLTPATIVSRSHLMTEIREARKRGYAVNREELTRGLVAFAAPIFERTGRVEAAISLTLTTGAVVGEAEKGLVDELLKSATLISRDLGYSPESLQTPSGNRSNQKKERGGAR